MDTTPVTPGVLEGLDRLLALNPRPETQAAVVTLKGDYAARAAHEARVRAAKEELEAAEAGLLAHGYPHEPSAIVDEEILSDMERAIGEVLGVDHRTVSHDLDGENSPPSDLEPAFDKDVSGENSPPLSTVATLAADEKVRAAKVSRGEG